MIRVTLPNAGHWKENNVETPKCCLLPASLMHGHTHSYITVVYTLSIFCHTLINEGVQYFAQGGAECAQHNVQSPNQVSHETSALWWESSQSYWLTRLRTVWRFPRAPSDSIRNIIQLKAKCHISAYLPTAGSWLSSSTSVCVTVLCSLQHWCFCSCLQCFCASLCSKVSVVE